MEPWLWDYHDMWACLYTLVCVSCGIWPIHARAMYSSLFKLCRLGSCCLFSDEKDLTDVKRCHSLAPSSSQVGRLLSPLLGFQALLFSQVDPHSCATTLLPLRWHCPQSVCHIEVRVTLLKMKGFWALFCLQVLLLPSAENPRVLNARIKLPDDLTAVSMAPAQLCTSGTVQGAPLSPPLVDSSFLWLAYFCHLLSPRSISVIV